MGFLRVDRIPVAICPQSRTFPAGGYTVAYHIASQFCDDVIEGDLCRLRLLRRLISSRIVITEP